MQGVEVLRSLICLGLGAMPEYTQGAPSGVQQSAGITRGPQRYFVSAGLRKVLWRRPIPQKNRAATSWPTPMLPLSTRSTNISRFLRRFRLRFTKPGEQRIRRTRWSPRLGLPNSERAICTPDRESQIESRNPSFKQLVIFPQIIGEICLTQRSDRGMNGHEPKGFHRVKGKQGMVSDLCIYS